MRSHRVVLVAGVAVAITAWAPAARAATIMVDPSDSYTKIEAAGAGNEVVTAPGTYKFRVYLTKQRTAAQPIVIRAQDPTQPPVSSCLRRQPRASARGRRLQEGS